MAEITILDEAAWLEQRRNVVGGHSACAILGLSSYTSPLDVWLEATGRPRASLTSPAMERGRILEPAILAELERREGRAFQRPPDGQHWLMRDDDVPFFAGSPDAIDEPAIIEVKTAGLHTRHKWTDIPPDEAVVQALWYAGIARLPVCKIVLFDVVSDEMRDYTVEVDHEAVRQMRERVEDWWMQHVIMGKQPSFAPDDQAQWALAADAIDRMYPKASGVEIVATPDVRSLAAEYAAAKRAVDEAEEKKKAIRAQLSLALGEAARAKWEGGSVSWHNVSGRAATDWEALAKELAQQLAIGDEALEVMKQSVTTQKGGHRQLKVTLKEDV